MKKITITTWYEIEDNDSSSNTGEISRTLKASTEADFDDSIVALALVPIFDIHTEKCGAIELKLLKQTP